MGEIKNLKIVQKELSQKDKTRLEELLTMARKGEISSYVFAGIGKDYSYMKYSGTNNIELIGTCELLKQMLLEETELEY
jgi:hypothetical protein